MESRTYVGQYGKEAEPMRSSPMTITACELKVVNGVTTNYTLNGKNIVHMTQGSNDLHFFYDAQGKPGMVTYNDVDYFYVYNLQGDVVALIDANGTQVVEYVYDAWGALIAKTGSMVATLGTVNPFRYRGYIYDEETGLYYLRSRYYNRYGRGSSMQIALQVFAAAFLLIMCSRIVAILLFFLPTLAVKMHIGSLIRRTSD